MRVAGFQTPAGIFTDSGAVLFNAASARQGITRVLDDLAHARTGGKVAFDGEEPCCARNFAHARAGGTGRVAPTPPSDRSRLQESQATEVGHINRLLHAPVRIFER